MKVAVIHNRDRAGVLNVFGPQNRERYNPRTVEMVAAALEKGGHTVRVLDGNMYVIEQLRDFMPRVIEGERPGMVFNMAYGIQGVSRYTHLPAMLEMLGVSYVGSNPMAHGLALDKVIAKIVFQNAGLPTAAFWNFASPDDQFDDLRFPAIVKPKMEAVSFGIRVVDNEGDLREAVAELIREFQQHVLVEEFIVGREFAIGVLGNVDPEVFPIVEIALDDPTEIQTASDKLKEPLGKICPAELTAEKTEELQSLVRRAFRSLDLFDFARVDLRMDEEGKPYILEINSMASLGMTGTYVHAAKVAGYTFDALVNRILDVAAVRYFGQDYATEAADAAKIAKSEKLSVRVRSYLRSHSGTIEEALARMVELRSPVDDVEHVNAFGEWLTAQMKHLGFAARIYPQSQAGNVIYYSNHEDDEDDVLLLGHLDTPAQHRHFVPYREDGSRLYGTGISESKGGIAVALAALRALRFARALRRIRCGFLVTTDDTRHGVNGREFVQQHTSRARRVIGLKPAGTGGELVLSRAGRGTYKLEAQYGGGKAATTSAHVIAQLFRRLRRLQRFSDLDRGVQISIRRINVDAPFGRLPDRAEATVTLRFNRLEDGERVHEELRAVGEQRSTRGVRYRVTGGIRRPPMEKNAASDEFFQEVDRIAMRIHVPVAAAHRWHSADICFAAGDTAKLDGMGPIGFAERTENEHVLRNSLVDHAALLALVIRHCRK